MIQSVKIILVNIIQCYYNWSILLNSITICSCHILYRGLCFAKDGHHIWYVSCHFQYLLNCTKNTYSSLEILHDGSAHFLFIDFLQKCWSSFKTQIRSKLTRNVSKLCWMSYIVSKNGLTSAFLVLFGSRITSKRVTLEKNKADFRNLHHFHHNNHLHTLSYEKFEIFIFTLRKRSPLNESLIWFKTVQ